MKLLAFLSFVCCISQFKAVSLDSVKNELLPTKQICGSSSDDTPETEFPWTAFIPLKSRMPNSDANIRCTGTLINKRYVIINKSSLQFALTKVHLGINTVKNDSCDKNCDKVLELGIEERVIDEKRDIVLLRLDQDVTYTDTIKPICLPFDDFKRPESGATVYTSGWGLIANEGPVSDTKKKVKHTLISNEDCKKSGRITDVNYENIICVKVTDDSISKPCNGDEGSPIMFNGKGQWVLEGVLTSLFDSKDLPCSVKDPARGSRITDEVLQWIVDKIHA